MCKIIVNKGGSIMSKTQLAHGIDITETKSKYDTRAKYLVSNKQVLARIMKFSVLEYKECNIEEIINYIEGTPEVETHSVLPQNEKIEGMDTTSKIPGEGEVSFDIRFNALTPQKEKIKIIINIQLQKDYHPGYHFCSRGIFYCSRMISEQVYTEFVPDNYDDIKKVYSIWLCMEAPRKYANTITEYSMEERNVFGEFTGIENYDLLSVLIIRLCTDENADCENQLINMLNVLLSTKLKAEQKKEILEKEHQMKMSVEMEGEARNMCNLSDLIVERTTQEVTKVVTEEVAAKETVQSVTNLMENLQLSLEKACDALGKTVEEFHAAKQVVEDIQKQ